jgi:Flp pilus assembly protein TadG
VATLILPLLLWTSLLAGVVIIDLSAYLVAAARAQQLADAASLAAVSDAVRGPRAAAERVVAAGAGSLDACDCPAGADRATVDVSVAVPGLLLPRLGASRVTATAEAALVGPGHPSGTTGDR